MSLRITSETSKKIQILRAFAIIAVVMIHTCEYGTKGIFVRPFINFAVALFLGLSGFLTKEDMSMDKVKKRLMRVFIPYTIWSIVYTAVRDNWDEFLLDFVSGYSCGVFYFIMVYMQLTLLTPAISRLMKSRYRNLGYLITPIAIFIQYILAWNDIVIEKPWNEVFFPVWFLFFYLGMVLRYDLEHKKNCYLNIEEKRSLMTKIFLIALPLSLAIQTEEGFLWKSIHMGRFAYSQIRLSSMLTSAVIILMAVHWITSKRHIPFTARFANVLVYIGDISFGIYFTHMLWVDFLEDSFHWTIRELFPQATFVVLILSIIAIYIVRQLCSKKMCQMLGLV